jgi:hypothetical protein
VETIGTENIEVRLSGDLNVETRIAVNGKLTTVAGPEVVRYTSRKVGLGFETYDQHGVKNGTSSIDGRIGQYVKGVQVGEWKTFETIAPGLAVEKFTAVYEASGRETAYYKGKVMVTRYTYEGDRTIQEEFDPTTHNMLSRVTTVKSQDYKMSILQEYFDPKTKKMAQRCQLQRYGAMADQSFGQIQQIYDAADTGNLILQNKARVTHYSGPAHTVLESATLYDPKTRDVILTKKENGYGSGKVNYQNPKLAVASKDWETVAEAAVPSNCEAEQPSAIKEGLRLVRQATPATTAQTVGPAAAPSRPGPAS